MSADKSLAIDCHLHTVYSGHGRGTVADQVARAGELGLTVIAFTEHLTLPDGFDPKWEDSMSPEEARAYRDEIFQQRELHPEMRIVYGAEADWLGDEDYLLEVAQGYDYLLGSVHFLDGWGFDNPDNLDGWQERSVDGVWQRYLELWCQACESKVSFTCMAHPDLPKLFGYLPEEGLSEMYAQMARCAADNGRIVEVNTAGWRKPVDEQYPALELLTAFRDAAVPCSVGSDAHRPEDVGFCIDNALQVMRSAGYDVVAVPCVGGGLEFRAL